MPSTLVHCSLAALIAAGILGTAYNRRALLVVLVVTAIPDLDAFGTFLVESPHRALLHTVLIPIGAGFALYCDTHLRGSSFVRDRYGDAGVRVAWVCVLAYAFAGIGLDLFTSGVNLFYPLHDQFYRFSGTIELSTQRGLVQTFVEGIGSGTIDVGQLGSTEEVHVSTGVDPVRGPDPTGIERVFPIVRAGWQLLLILSALVTIAGRELARRDRADEL